MLSLLIIGRKFYYMYEKDNYETTNQLAPS